MKVELTDTEAVITREPTDPKIYKESTFFYHIKQALAKQGHDVIVKSPGKETLWHHLTDMPYYVRSRKYKKGVTSFWILDNNWAIRPVYEEYNQKGEVRLGLERHIFDKELDSTKAVSQ